MEREQVRRQLAAAEAGRSACQAARLHHKRAEAEAHKPPAALEEQAWLVSQSLTGRMGAWELAVMEAFFLRQLCLPLPVAAEAADITVEVAARPAAAVVGAHHSSTRRQPEWFTFRVRERATGW